MESRRCRETVGREEGPEGKRVTAFPSSLAKRAEEQGYISLFLSLRLYGSEKVFFSSSLLSFEDDNSGIT